MMKSLKTILAATLMLLSGKFIPGQSLNLKAGYTNSGTTLQQSVPAIGFQYARGHGFHAGAEFEFPLGTYFSVAPGLYLNTKGEKFYSIEETQIEVYGDNFYVRDESSTTLRTTFLEIPLSFRVTLPVNDDLKISGILVPWAEIGLTGSSRYYEKAEAFLNEDLLGSEETELAAGIQWGTDQNRFGAGLGAGIEVRFRSFLLSTQYDFGFTSATPNDFFGLDSRRRVLKCSLGYRFDLSQ